MVELHLDKQETKVQVVVSLEIAILEAVPPEGCLEVLTRGTQQDLGDYSETPAPIRVTVFLEVFLERLTLTPLETREDYLVVA